MHKGIMKGFKANMYIYSRGQKRFMFRLRRTVEKRFVPFPLYGQPFLGTLFVPSANGREYGKSMVAKRKRNGHGTAKRTSVISQKAAAVSLRRRRPAITYRSVPGFVANKF